MTTMPHPPKIVAVADDFDHRLILATQGGLPLVAEPYAQIANQLETDENTVIQRLQHLLENGVIRRIGAVPNHYALGYAANGMSVWNVSDEQVDTLGQQIGELSFVTHCYRRPRHLPHWPYNLFAMLHGRNRDEVAQQATVIAQLLGAHCCEHDILYSTQILKKTGLRLNGLRA